MIKQADVVVVGGGHNALVAAAYLVKAGVSVAVIERNEYMGGGVVTREVTLPGHKSDIHSLGHIHIQANPVLKHDELGLVSKYGLKYLYPELMLSFPFEDGVCVRVYRDLDRTCAGLEKISRVDAENYRRFHGEAKESMELLSNSLFSPPPPFGALMAQLDQTEPGRLLQRTLLMNPQEIACELFEDIHMRLFFLKWISEGMVGPTEKGNGGMFMAMVPFMHTYGMALPEGGSGALTDALLSMLRDHGVELVFSNPVKKVVVQGRKARSVVLASGDEITAKKAVLAGLHPFIWMDLVGKENLPPALAKALSNIKSSTFVAFKYHMALNEPVRFKQWDDLTESAYVGVGGSTLEEMYERNEVRMRKGIPPMPGEASMAFVQPSVHDPTRAPAGKQTAEFYGLVPYNLRDGGPAKWDEIKQEVADNMMLTMQKYAANLDSSNILAAVAESPLDMERNNPCMVGGDIHGMANGVFQALGRRPVPGLSQYRTPIESFYICGPTTHPGGGVNGGGRVAARVLMEDLGIDPEKVMSLG